MANAATNSNFPNDVDVIKAGQDNYPQLMADAMTKVQKSLTGQGAALPSGFFATNPPLGTQASPVQGVVRIWGGGFFDPDAPQNPNAGGTDLQLLQGAVNAAQSTTAPGLVWITRTYTTNGQLSITATVYMMGPGTVIEANGTNQSTLIDARTNANNCVFAFFTLDGNRANNTGSQMMNLVLTTDHLVYGVTFQHSPGHGLRMANSVATNRHGGRADSCRATDIKGTAFDCETGTQMRVYNCQIQNVVTGGQCILFNNAADCIAMNNQVGPGLVSGVQGIKALAGADRCIIANNKIVGNDDCIQVLASHCIVTGNSITGDGVGTGGQGISLLTNASYCVVANNNILGNQTNNATPNIGIACDIVNVGTQRGHLIIGNTCRQCGSFGISVGGSSGKARRITIVDNVCLDNFSYGLKLTVGDIDGVYAEGNQLFGNLPGPYANDGTATNVVLRNNPGLNPVGPTAFALAATTVLAGNPTPYDGTLYLGGGTMTGFALGGVKVPVNSAFSTATTGGTLADATTFFYRVSALNSAGETLASTETSIATGSGGNLNTVTVKWGFVTGATGYNVYGRTTGAELKIATNVQDNQFIDTGAVTPSGALPGADTTGNASIGITAAAPAGAVHSIRLAALQNYKATYSVTPTSVVFVAD